MSGTSRQLNKQDCIDLRRQLADLGVFRRRSDDRIDVPDLYLFGLNLRRKGGVRRGPQSGTRT